MYHGLKNKEVKPPKGWHFSGDPSFLNLANNDFNIYFLIINTEVKIYRQTGRTVSTDMDEWEVEERHGQTGVTIKRGQKLTSKEAKEIAVKLAKNLNKKRFMSEFIKIVVTAVLAGLASFIVSKL